MTYVGELMQDRLDDHKKVVEDSFTDAVSRMSKSSSDIFIKSHSQLELTFQNIANGVESINRALKDLGEKKIPNEAKKKRGFFSKS